jgi:hypothetical protein
MIIPFLSGCSQVHVIDAAGTPIPQAEVWSQSLSMDIGPNLTDAHGDAEVPSNIQGTKWIRVARTGYASAIVAVPAAYPLTITLNRE